MRFIVFLSFAFIILFPMRTKACECFEPLDLSSSYKRATSVVLAEVTDTRLVKSVHKEHDLEYVIANINILKSYKSNITNSNINQVIDLVVDEGNCSIGLMSGVEYIFFIDTRRSEEEYLDLEPEQNNYVGQCTGSHMVNIYGPKFKKEQSILNALTKKKQRKVNN